MMPAGIEKFAGRLTREESIMTACREKHSFTGMSEGFLCPHPLSIDASRIAPSTL